MLMHFFFAPTSDRQRHSSHRRRIELDKTRQRSSRLFERTLLAGLAVLPWSIWNIRLSSTIYSK